MRHMALSVFFFFFVKMENYTPVRQIRSNKGEMSWRNVREIKRILRAAELVRGDRSERTGPLRGGSVSGNDMNTIDLGSSVGATLCIKSDKGWTASSGGGASLLSDVKEKGNAVSLEVGDDAAMAACISSKEEALHLSPTYPPPCCCHQAINAGGTYGCRTLT